MWKGTPGGRLNEQPLPKPTTVVVGQLVEVPLPKPKKIPNALAKVRKISKFLK